MANKVEKAPKAEIKKAPEDTVGKKKFEALIETYKEQNPVKYEAKKERLEAKLKSL